MVRRTIKQLPEALIHKIAAGEVIERPASIAKELIENAVDAGASRIEIRVTDGGRKSISITDDGHGMSEDEVLLALRRHTTSKISTFDDLESVSTFGFRGEALSSIAAISHMDILTKCEDGTAGSRIRTEGGVIRSKEPYGTPIGTTIVISNLFYNTPARKKFLKGKSTEFGYLERTVRQISLSETGVTFLLEHEGQVSLNLPATKNLKERIGQLYKMETTSRLLPFSAEDGLIRIQGHCSNTHLSFSRAQGIWMYVNDRFVRDRTLQAAIMEGYRTAMMERKYPLVVLKVELPGDLVDVNVHPAKSEVRFTDSQRIFQLVSRGIKDAIGAPSKTSFQKPSPYPLSQQVTLSGVGTLVETYASKTVPTPVVTLDSKPETLQKGPYASLEVLGSIDNTYIACREDKAIVILDQHAAHERVLFEKLRSSYLNKEPKKQKLLLPLTLEVSAERENAIAKLLPLLSRVGFEIESFGPKTFIIKSVPSLLGSQDCRPIIIDLADEVIQEQGANAFEEKLDDIFSSLACHSAVRAHDRLSTVEIQTLLKDMDGIDLATNCPHGRPTFIRFSVDQLEKLFKRK